MQNMNLLPDRVGCLLNISRLRLKIRIVRVEEHADQSCCWNEIVQEPDPLCLNSRQQKIYPCRVAAWPVEAGDEAELDRVVAGTEDDRNGRGCCFGSERRLRAPCRGDDGDVTVNQIGRERRQPIELVLRPAKFDRDVVAVDEPGFLQAVTECRYPVNGIGSRGGIKETDHRYRLSLRARHERPPHSAAEQRDKCAAFHSITSSARASTEDGISSPSALAVLRLITSSYLVGACTGRSAGFSPLRMRST